MRHITRPLLCLLCMAPAYGLLNAQSRAEEGGGDTRREVVLFQKGSAVIDSVRYETALDSLARTLNGWMRQSPAAIADVTVNAYASPEGGKSFNIRLARERAENLRKWIASHTLVPDSLVRVGTVAVDWAGLASRVREDANVPRQKEALEVIASEPEETFVKGKFTDSRLRRLQITFYGRTYIYLNEHHFAPLRYGEIITRLKDGATQMPETIIFHEEETGEEPPAAEEPAVTEEVAVPVVPEEVPAVIEEVPAVIEEASPVPEAQAVCERRPLFSLKSNLLYDLALTPNIEVEVPVGKRWSVHGEFQHGWWLKSDDSFCWQLEAAGLEGRYWLGDRSGRGVLTGWFVGLFAGAGVYDFQLKKDRGYQGDFYISAGVSAGYAVQFGSSPWGMEFSAGAGYLTTDYTPHTPNPYVQHELLRDGADQRFRGILPLKAKVSLIYLFSRKVKVKGGAE